MKSKTKISTIKGRRLGRSKVQPSILVHAKRPLLRHFRLIKHSYTGKLIHHRHTSHLALTAILVSFGFFLLTTGTYASAVTQSGTVSIGMIVPGPAPTVGAEITSPINGVVIKDESNIDISGTCPKDTFVVITDNKTPVGSIMCSDAGIFKVKIQLFIGDNDISALNYDNLNQAGPVTSSINVVLKKTDVPPVVTPTDPITVVEPVEPIIPILPENPSIVPGASSSISDCSQYRVGVLPTGGEPHVTVVCLPRLFLPNVKQVMGFVVWGGTPPYAISIDLGNENSSETVNDVIILSLATPGYKTVEISYAAPKTYKLALSLKDEEGKAAIVNTSVQVSGQITDGGGSTIDDTDDTETTPLGISWLQSPVPFYLVAVAITLGFWIGDIFDRKFGVKQQPKFRKLKRVG